jgi:hypothetical protein
MKNILVIGDWVVDEHWVTGVHRSPTASRTGQAHFRGLHPLNCSIQSFCAAGQTAAILQRAKLKDDGIFEVFGVGVWHSQDTAALSELLLNNAIKGQTPFRITYPVIRKPKTSRLFNLADIYKEFYEGKDYFGTTRVIRIYQNTGNKIELLQRIDWEKQFPKELKLWDKKIDKEQFVKLLDFIQEIGKKIDAIIIKDICKGVVTDKLIKWIKDKIAPREIPWYISTKAWQPSWIKELRDVNVKLILIPQVAAQMALKKEKFKFWITKTGHISKGALEKLDDMSSYFTSNPTIIVLPFGSTIIGRFYEKGDVKCILQTDPEPKPLPVGLPMASVFFPALIANQLLSEIQKNKLEPIKLLSESLGFTQKWMISESQRVENPELWNPDKETRLELGTEKYAITAGKWNTTFNWADEKNQWEEAFINCGIIKKGDKKFIELWRSMTEVEGFVTCVKTKRFVLQTLVEELQQYKKAKKRQHKSFMLIASPGSGKSFLVKCLAKANGFRYLPFNITQMLSKTDILDCFDTIVTTQTQNREEPILVFIDEINATLETQFVYDTFLAPLEEGIYVRSGKTFHIDPCVWIFAGTRKPVETKKTQLDNSIKASDFESRLSLPPLEFDILEDKNKYLHEFQVEKVYLGVSLLRTFFPDVRNVSEKVLQLFQNLKPDMPVRELKHFVKTFNDIQYGQVLSKNINIDKLDKDFDIDTWRKLQEGDNVEII